MPVYKYRRVEDMEDRRLEPGTPELFRAIRAVWGTAERLTQPRYPPGVHKCRSIEEADALRKTWDQANFEAFQARRR